MLEELSRKQDEMAGDIDDDSEDVDILLGVMEKLGEAEDSEHVLLESHDVWRFVSFINGGRRFGMDLSMLLCEAIVVLY